jgi:hypothetical protein
MTDTLNDVAADKQEVDQQRLAEQLRLRPRSRGSTWSARTGC